jgi:hypothetical protein
MEETEEEKENVRRIENEVIVEELERKKVFLSPSTLLAQFCVHICSENTGFQSPEHMIENCVSSHLFCKEQKKSSQTISDFLTSHSPTWDMKTRTIPLSPSLQFFHLYFFRTHVNPAYKSSRHSRNPLKQSLLSSHHISRHVTSPFHSTFILAY